jgi:valyl-tRNA synthetase
MGWIALRRGSAPGELLAESGPACQRRAHENNVGFSERANVPIEPRLSEQWFLRYPKTEEALAVVAIT